MRIRNQFLSAAVLVIGGGCAQHRPPPSPPAPPRPVVDFVPVPEAEAAAILNPHGGAGPHSGGGKALCQRCHERGAPGVKKDPIALCADCHDAARMRHAFRVDAPAHAVGKVPLLPGNLIACHTCHDPHDVEARRAGLRMRFRELCLACHDGHGDKDPMAPR